ncbi:MAG: OmpA family protein [bacterium]
MKSIPRLVFVIALGAGLIAAGCATTSHELEQAEQSYSAAANDPAITRNASVTLYEARKALDRGRDAGSQEDQEHYAYVAQKKIELARVQADQLETSQQVEQLEKQQQQFLASIRREKTEEARQQAEQARQELHAYRAQETERVQSELEQLRQELDAKQTDQGMVLTLSDVVFDFNEAQLKPGAERGLGRLTDYLRKNPDRRILVEGFTDNVGSDPYNRRLSEERAEAVARALEAEGVSPDRITTRGHGEAYPVATNETAAGRQRNRRVEVTILNQGSQPGAAG